mgnify:CR=1 FL=1
MGCGGAGMAALKVASDIMALGKGDETGVEASARRGTAGRGRSDQCGIRAWALSCAAFIASAGFMPPNTAISAPSIIIFWIWR